MIVSFNAICSKSVAHGMRIKHSNKTSGSILFKKALEKIKVQRQVLSTSDRYNL
jgi:hypothetical protein